MSTIQLHVPSPSQKNALSSYYLQSLQSEFYSNFPAQPEDPKVIIQKAREQAEKFENVRRLREVEDTYNSIPRLERVLNYIRSYFASLGLSFQIASAMTNRA